MGRYIDENLAKDEKLLMETRLHWIIFAWSVVWLLIGFMTLMGSIVAKSWLGAGVAIGLLVLGALIFLFHFIERKYAEFALTNKRVLIKVGVFSVKTLETQLNKISNISVLQGIVGRIFGYGTLTITSTGSVTEKYPHIEKPIEFKKRIQEHIENH